MSKKNRAVKKVKKVSELKVEAVRQSKSLMRCLNSSYFKSEDFRNVGKNIISYIDGGVYQPGNSPDIYVLDVHLDKVQKALINLAITLDELQERTEGR